MGDGVRGWGGGRYWDGWDVNIGSLPEGVLNERRGC